MRVAMHGQEIQVELREPPHRRLDCIADIEQFHVQEDALALFLLQLVGECQAAAGEHPQPDLVEGNGVAQPLGQGQSSHGVGHVKGDDQAIVGKHVVCHVGILRLGLPVHTGTIPSRQAG